MELAGIPRSTYYDLVKKMNRPDQDADLKAEIKAIYEENEGRYGYRRIRDELMNESESQEDSAHYERAWIKVCCAYEEI